MPHCSNYTGALNHAPVSLLVNTNQIYLKYLLYKIIIIFLMIQELINLLTLTNVAVINRSPFKASEIDTSLIPQ